MGAGQVYTNARPDLSKKFLAGAFQETTALEFPQQKPLVRALWSPLDGIWGVLRGSWEVPGHPLAQRPHILGLLGKKDLK